MLQEGKRQFIIALTIISMLVMVFSVSGLSTPSVQAASAPNIVTYQGRVLDANGAPVSSSTLSMKFFLYTAASGGTCVWSNSSGTCHANTPASTTARSVILTSGLFSENLGDTAAGTPYAAIADTTFADNAGIYLEVEIAGESLSPRKQLVAAPYALNADTLDGIDLSAIQLWESGTNGSYEDDAATIVGADAAFSYATGGAGDLRVADHLEVMGDAYIDNNFIVGASTSSTETIDDVLFSLGGNDLFVAGELGVEGIIYNDEGITTAGTLAVTGISTFTANVNANGGLDVDDAFVVADGGVLTTSQTANFDGAVDFDSTWDFSGGVGQNASPLVFEGETSDEFETIFAITDPTLSDRTQTFQNNSGIIPLSTAGNTLFFTTSAATALTLPTSGTLSTLAGSESLSGKTLVSPTITTSPTATGATWTDLGSVTTIDINGGSIDGTTIGLDSASSGAFTTLSASSTLGVTGTATVGDLACTDCLDFAEFVDAMSLDASSSIAQDAAETFTISNEGTANTMVDLTSTGDFAVRDAGTDFFSFNDDRSIDYSSNQTTTDPFDFTVDSVTLGNGLDFSADGLTTGRGIYLTSSSGVATSADVFAVAASGQYLTTGQTVSGNLVDASRSLDINDGAVETIILLSVTSPVVTISDNCFSTGNDTCVHSGNVLALTQSYASSTGNALSISNAGSGDSINIAGAGTGTAIDIDATTYGIDIELQNGLTIDNDDDNDLNLIENGLTLNIDFGEATASEIGYSSSSDLNIISTSTNSDSLTINAMGVGGGVTISGGSGAADAGEDGNDVALEAADDVLVNHSDDFIWTLGDDGTFFYGAGSTINFNAEVTANTTTTGVIDLDVDTITASNIGFSIDYQVGDASASSTYYSQKNDVTIDADAAHTPTVYGNYIGLTINEDTAVGYGLGIEQQAGAEVLTAGILIDNLDADDGMTNGILLRSAAGTIVDAIDASDAEITNALNAGQNFIVFDTTQTFGSAAGTITWEDTSGNDLMTLTDNADVGDLTLTGTLAVSSTSIFTDAASFDGGANPANAGVEALGTSSLEWDGLYIGDDGNGVSFGADQDFYTTFNTITSTLNTFTQAIASANIDYALYTLAADSTSVGMTANAEVFEIGKSSSSPAGIGWTELFAVDEDGDVTVAGTVTLDLDTTASQEQAVCHPDGDTTDVLLGDCDGAPAADYAEQYPVAAGVNYGDIVVPGSIRVTTTDGDLISQLVKSTQPYEGPVAGIVSNNYGDFTSAGYNINETDNPMPIALVGRVSVNVTNENGSIKVGDYLTTSSTSGHAMKATEVGRVIGMALADFNGTTGQVMVQVNNGWYMGDVIASDGSSTVVTDKAVMAPLTTASAATPGVDSYGFALRGSAWDGAEAQAVEMMLKTSVADTNNFRLSVRNTTDTEVAYITNQGKMQIAGDLVIGGNIYPSDRGVPQASKYIYYDGSEGAGGDFMRTNAKGWSTGSYDFAEMFPSSESLQAGEVVVFGGTGEEVVRSMSANSQMIAGIVSTRPGFLAGENAPGAHPIALSGRVPTRVSDENGAVSVGDPLTTSSKPGFAMKATESGMIVGYALEPLTAGEKTMLVYVNVGYWAGKALANAPGTNNQASVFATGTNVNYSALNMTGNIYVSGNEILSVGRIAGIGDVWKIEQDGTIKTEALLKTVITSYTDEKVETIAVTSPEAVITLTGTAKLSGGQTEVRFEDIAPSFNDVTAADAPLRVIVTPSGPVSLFVSEKDNNHFVVKQFAGEQMDVEFDWMVTAYRKGYEPEEEDEPSVILSELQASEGSQEILDEPFIIPQADVILSESEGSSEIAVPVSPDSTIIDETTEDEGGNQAEQPSESVIEPLSSTQEDATP